jgi:hypothetical protein
LCLSDTVATSAVASPSPKSAGSPASVSPKGPTASDAVPSQVQKLLTKQKQVLDDQAAALCEDDFVRVAELQKQNDQIENLLKKYMNADGCRSCSY